jgi:hypothetical protein
MPTNTAILILTGSFQRSARERFVDAPRQRIYCRRRFRIVGRSWFAKTTGFAKNGLDAERLHSLTHAERGNEKPEHLENKIAATKKT